MWRHRIGGGAEGRGVNGVGMRAGILCRGEMPVTIRMWSTEWTDVGRMLGLDVNERAGKHIVEQKLANYRDRYIVICNAEMEFPGYMCETTGKWMEEEGQPPNSIACRSPMTTVRPVSENEWKEASTLNTNAYPYTKD